MTNLEKEIKSTKQKYWNQLVKESKRKKQTNLKERHITVYACLLEKYGLFNSDSPFEFPNEKTKRAFMAEFAKLGHTHPYSRLCKCNKNVLGSC
jgi:hypothetical protein